MSRTKEVNSRRDLTTDQEPPGARVLPVPERPLPDPSGLLQGSLEIAKKVMKASSKGGRLAEFVGYRRHNLVKHHPFFQVNCNGLACGVSQP